jgi:antitoxin HigA-1
MMKNPPHPGVGLKDELDALGVSVAETGKALGVTRQQLYRLINGECAITPEMALRLQMAIGSSADFWDPSKRLNSAKGNPGKTAVLSRRRHKRSSGGNPHKAR